MYFTPTFRDVMVSYIIFFGISACLIHVRINFIPEYIVECVSLAIFLLDLFLYSGMQIIFEFVFNLIWIGHCILKGKEMPTKKDSDISVVFFFISIYLPFLYKTSQIQRWKFVIIPTKSPSS